MSEVEHLGVVVKIKRRVLDGTVFVRVQPTKPGIKGRELRLPLSTFEQAVKEGDRVLITIRHIVEDDSGEWVVKVLPDDETPPAVPSVAFALPRVGSDHARVRALMLAFGLL